VLSDQAEKRLGYTATEQDKERLHESLPKITVVDKAGVEKWSEARKGES